MKPSVPMILSFNGGFVDTAGFLALQGLFTAHVTGNFVTFGASMVLGTSGALAKLLALPVFCAVVILTRLASLGLPSVGLPVMRTMVGLQVLLLAVGAALAIWLGPFANGDAWPAMATGLTLVAAMAIQNAGHRIHLADAPPTTLMTGTTTQIMIDVADLLHGVPAGHPARARVVRMASSVAAFAAGCAVAAALFYFAGPWCFLVPPVAVLTVLMMAEDKAIGAQAL